MNILSPIKLIQVWLMKFKEIHLKVSMYSIIIELSMEDLLTLKVQISLLSIKTNSIIIVHMLKEDLSMDFMIM
jgi:hypothetical protein